MDKSGSATKHKDGCKRLKADVFDSDKEENQKMEIVDWQVKTQTSPELHVYLMQRLAPSSFSSLSIWSQLYPWDFMQHITAVSVTMIPLGEWYIQIKQLELCG